VPDHPQLEENISAEDAIALSGGDVWLLDVREQSEWDGGHAPTAHLLPMSTIGQRIGEVPKDVPLLVVCHSGARSLQVTAALLDAGYQASNVLGGMMAWRSAGGPIVVGDAPESSPAPRA
jgi:rhodanese-related sulfurtransferase